MRNETNEIDETNEIGEISEIDETNASWPGWETVYSLGRGSFGSVYEIRRKIDGRVERAALKVISIPREDDIAYMRYMEYDDASAKAYCADIKEKALHEYALMAKLKGHPNIVSCDDMRVEPRADGIGWDIMIKMERLKPLYETLPSALNEALVLRLGMDLCSALAACREADIVHRDVKPWNIFVSRGGVYKLGDFGRARVIERTMPGSRAGTLDYMSPEVFHRKEYGCAADQYSLGLILYWILNDWRLPFVQASENEQTRAELEAARVRRVYGEPIPPPQNGGEALKQLVLRACAYEPGDRYAEPMEMRRALETIYRP